MTLFLTTAISLYFGIGVVGATLLMLYGAILFGLGLIIDT